MNLNSSPWGERLRSPSSRRGLARARSLGPAGLCPAPRDKFLKLLPKQFKSPPGEGEFSAVAGTHGGFSVCPSKGSWAGRIVRRGTVCESPTRVQDSLARKYPCTPKAAAANAAPGFDGCALSKNGRRPAQGGQPRSQDELTSSGKMMERYHRYSRRFQNGRSCHFEPESRKPLEADD